MKKRVSRSIKPLITIELALGGSKHFEPQDRHGPKGPHLVLLLAVQVGFSISIEGQSHSPSEQDSEGTREDNRDDTDDEEAI